MIRTFEDYWQVQQEKLPEILAMFEGVNQLSEAEMKANMLKHYTAKIEPSVKLIGQTTGDANNFFNPIRTITNVDYYFGRVYVFYKRKGDKRERYEPLN